MKTTLNDSLQILPEDFMVCLLFYFALNCFIICAKMGKICLAPVLSDETT